MEDVTYRQIIAFQNNARQFLSKKKEKTKLHYALQKMVSRMKCHVDKYYDIEQEIRIDLAEADKDGRLIMQGTQFTFSRENTKELLRRVRELKNEKVQIEPYIATQVPDDLEAIWYEFFVPFVIEDKEPE